MLFFYLLWLFVDDCVCFPFGHPLLVTPLPPFSHPLSPVKERESAWSQFFSVFFFFSYFVVRIVVDVLLMLPADCRPRGGRLWGRGGTAKNVNFWP